MISCSDYYWTSRNVITIYICNSTAAIETEVPMPHRLCVYLSFYLSIYTNKTDHYYKYMQSVGFIRLFSEVNKLHPCTTYFPGFWTIGNSFYCVFGLFHFLSLSAGVVWYGFSLNRRYIYILITHLFVGIKGTISFPMTFPLECVAKLYGKI